MHSHDAWMDNNFFSGEPSFGFKTDIYHFKKLKDKLAELNIDLATYDINSIENSKIIICFDQAIFEFQKKQNQICYLIIHDVPLYDNRNWLIYNHINYDKVFTWNKDIVDSEKYQYYTLPIHIEDYEEPELTTKQEFDLKTLCVTVSSRGTVNLFGPVDSLSKERYKTIEWFEENFPKDFTLYGRGWKEDLFNYRGKRILSNYLPSNFLNFINNKISKNKKFTKVYGGELQALDKIKVLKGYKFYMCYENTSKFNGWITEKIFDCFSASCVPIYWGPDDITNFIPENCFINRKDFATNEDVYNFISQMPFDTYIEYLKNIRQFWISPSMEKFKTNNFADLISNHLVEDLKK